MDSNKRADLIFRNAAKLSYEERADVARRILEDAPAPRATAEERYGALLCIAEMVVGKQMTQSRNLYDVMIRRFVAYRLRNEGYVFTDIARAMGKHYTTVMHYVRIMRDCFDEPIFYASDINLYMSFDEAVGEAEEHVE